MTAYQERWARKLSLRQVSSIKDYGYDTAKAQWRGISIKHRCLCGCVWICIKENYQGIKYMRWAGERAIYVLGDCWKALQAKTRASLKAGNNVMFGNPQITWCTPSA